MELSRVGGLNVKDVTRRIMYKVFTNEVGILYSWEGAKKKKSFKNLAIASVILGNFCLLFLHTHPILEKRFFFECDRLYPKGYNNNYIFFNI